MYASHDIVIVGAGLAGVCSALHLAEHERILILEAGDKPGGASSAGAGLVNPFMARRARPVWRHREAIDALLQTLEMAGAPELIDRRGVFRPARDVMQAVAFIRTAAAHPECRWVVPAACETRFPEVIAPEGGLLVKSGGALSIPAFVERSLDMLSHLGVEIRMSAAVRSFEEDANGVRLSLADGSHVEAGRVIFACGSGVLDVPGLEDLNLHRVKGQTVTVRRPKDLDDMPHLAGSAYIVMGVRHVHVGTSYQHEFTDDLPEPAVSQQILDRAVFMLPALAGLDFETETAGIRLTVPGTRLPMVGPVPGLERTWVFTGLGSKGLLMAPLVARELRDFLLDPTSIPPALRPTSAD